MIIPDDLKDMYESSKLDTTMFVGSEIRVLIGRVARAEAALKALDDWFEKLQGTDTNDPLWMMRKRAHEVPRSIINAALNKALDDVERTAGDEPFDDEE